MRRLALSVTILLWACGGEAPPPQPPAPPAEPPVATVAPAPTQTAPPAPAKKPLVELQQAAGKAIAEAYAAGDAKKLAAVYTPNAVQKIAGMPDVVGRDNIEKGASEFFKSFSKIKMGEQRVFVKNEVVVSEWVINAVHSGDFMGTKATEKPVGWVGVTVAWFDDDGLVKEEHTYANAATLLSQIGASKEKSRGVPALPTGKPEVVGGPNATATGAAEIMKQVNTAWEKRDEKAFGALLADNAEWDDITLPEPAKGKAAVLKYFKTLTTAFPDTKLTTTNEWDFGEWIVEEGTFSGTNTGPYFGAPATKKPVTIHELTIAKVGPDKKIVRAITYGNDLEMTSQLNPPKAAPATPAKK